MSFEYTTLLTLLTKEIGVCQSSEELRLLSLLTKIINMQKHQLNHFPTPKYKVAYYVNILKYYVACSRKI